MVRTDVPIDHDRALPPTVSLPMAAPVVIAAIGFSHISIHNAGEHMYASCVLKIGHLPHIGQP